MSKHCLFVGHILYGRNNIYEEFLIEDLRKGMASIELVSVNKAKIVPEDRRNRNVHILRAYRKPILDEVIRFFAFFHAGARWAMRHKKNDCIMILLSAPVEVNLAAVWLRRIFHIKTVNLIIDTALGNIHTRSLWDRYNRICYTRSEKLTRKMTASMALNKRVFSYLKLENRPCLLTKIGHDRTTPAYSYVPARDKKRIIAYTGTLIYYDGTKELLEAMTYLDPAEYELHIYGKGPEESLVCDYQERYPHIKLMGYLPNAEMKRVMAEADLLINPRIDNEKTDIFGFPSKMVEYLLSGTPVLTTRFAAMPEAYRDFVYEIHQQTGKGIAEAIKSVFSDTEHNREEKCRKAYNYIFENNSYQRISEEMIAFFEKI